MCEYSYNGTALSGGLDTSIVNYISSNQEKNFESVSVGFKESSLEDLDYARKVADELEIENHIRTFNFEEAKEAAEKVVGILETFDPMEIRNSTALYFMLEKAKELGIEKILTGDGSDELFAGYSFLYELSMEKLPESLEKIWKNMSFSSQPIAESIGIEAKLPFLSKDFKKFAQNIEPEFKVGRRKGEKIGKWILRKAYEGRLSDEIIWRRKAPIEVGSGTTIFPKKFESEIEDDHFREKKKKIEKEDNVKIRSEEQLFYYELYRSKFGVPETEDAEARTCPYCGTNLSEKTSFCRTCGNGVKEK
ncbi:hypothetical protein AKJ52_02115 [candidate division MSBL1 archaeon SCGC-AAA382C18]|uniref:Asparagine synthetase domain-containing protein n=1 Tax=candidate division MSBL1 archaeon SCGC-AAA382C18 TaxID=1698281 RepID=A0A133VJG5_9EURY|nr:hypothetical protein AKJ52_02115 [candidate division MSBL1 archaeon SCGC-AAA382C18]